MGKIKNEDLSDDKSSNKKLTADEMEQVKGGPDVFIKFDGVDGESFKAGAELSVAPTTLKKRTGR